MPSFNIKTDYGAVGDGQQVTAVITASAASNTVAATTAVWNPATDNGKVIIIEGIGQTSPSTPANNAAHETTITGFPGGDGKTITIAATVLTSVSASSQLITFGTDDFAAFEAFRTANHGVADVVLTIPSGIYLLRGWTNGDTKRFLRGIPNPVVVGVGLPLLAGDMSLGTFTYPGQETTFPVTVAVASVKAGATSVQLLTPSQYTRVQPGRTFTQSDGTVFTSGAYGVMRCLDTQGSGDPNNYYWEFVKITNVDLSGAVTFSAPLHNSYSANFPTYNAGGAFTPNEGGPATLYILDAGWDAAIKISGVSCYTPSALCNMPVRTIELDACLWQNAYGPNVSMCETFIADACDLSACFTEIDKSVWNFIIRNGTVWRHPWFQSASIENFIVDGSTITTLQGTPKRSWFTNSAIGSLQIGPTGYGIAESISMSGCTVSSVHPESGATDSDITNPAGANQYTMINGVMTCVAGINAGGPVRWGIPGALMFFKGQAFSEAAFRVNLPSAPSSVDTSMTGLSAYPTVPLGGGTILDVVAAPYLSGIFDNNIGCDAIVDVSQQLARGKRYGEYSKRPFTQLNISPVDGVTPGNYSVGKLIKIVVTVGPAFTTAGTLTINLFGRFKARGVDPGGSTSVTSWNPAVDLKRAGTRTLIPGSGWTNAGGNDALTDIGALWLSGQQSPWANAAITPGDPGVLTIEVFTDQGFGSVDNNQLYGTFGIYNDSTYIGFL